MLALLEKMDSMCVSSQSEKPRMLAMFPLICGYMKERFRFMVAELPVSDFPSHVLAYSNVIRITDFIFSFRQMQGQRPRKRRCPCQMRTPSFFCAVSWMNPDDCKIEDSFWVSQLVRLFFTVQVMESLTPMPQSPSISWTMLQLQCTISATQ
jgi:hypothetical protein